MKKYYNFLLIFIFGCALIATENRTAKHVILPRKFHVGQKFIYEGVSYIIKGFDQEKKDDSETVTLVLEHPITLGFEFGKETLILTVKQGSDEKTGTVLNAHLQEYHYTYNWKAYALGLFLLKHYISMCFNIK